jgi:hypothetical protein
MRVLLVASVSMLAIAAPAHGPALGPLLGPFLGPAHGAEKQSWGFARSGKEVQVAYGIPESEVVTIVFRCEAKRIEIISTVLPRRPRKGQPARTTLSNGSLRAVYDGKFGSSSEGFYFEASTAADPKVVGILKSGTSLTISTPGKHERVPLKGVAAPLAQFEAACFRRR